MDIGGKGRGNERCDRREDGRLSKQPRKHTNRILRLRDRRSTVDGDDLSTSQSCERSCDTYASLHARQDGHYGLTSLVNRTGNSCLYMADKRYGNEECQPCCKIADAAIAVPGNLGGREARLASPELRNESGGYHLH